MTKYYFALIAGSVHVDSHMALIDENAPNPVDLAMSLVGTSVIYEFIFEGSYISEAVEFHVFAEVDIATEADRHQLWADCISIIEILGLQPPSQDNSRTRSQSNIRNFRDIK